MQNNDIKEIVEKSVRSVLEEAIHSLYPFNTVSRQYKEIKDEIRKLRETLEKHNGRLSTLEKWKERLKGASIATRTIWGVLVVYFVAMSFGLFQMYLTYEKINFIIKDEVEKILSKYEFSK